ncbi:MAG: DUF2937 family protein [Parvibaculaceae bacterium]
MGTIFRLACAALVAVLLSQFPEFVQQYRQRLGGAVDALAPIVRHFDETAARAGLDRGAALVRLRANPDDLVVGQTQATASAIDRFERLQRQAADLSTPISIERLGVFLTDYDPELARRTFDDFRPAVPATPDGIAHAGGGFVLGYGLAALLAWLGRLLFRRPRPALR